MAEYGPINPATAVDSLDSANFSKKTVESIDLANTLNTSFDVDLSIDNTTSFLLVGTEFVNFGNSTALERTDPWSAVGWLKRTVTSGRIIQKGNGTQRWSFEHNTSQTIGLYISDGTNTIHVESDTGVFSDSEYNHYAVTYDGSNVEGGIRIYKNGAEINRNTTTSGTLANSILNAEVLAMANSSSAYLGDEVAIYDIELSAAEVSAIYAGGKVINLALLGTGANQLTWWRADGSTNTTDGVLDSSGNGITGTIQNDGDNSVLQSDVP